MTAFEAYELFIALKQHFTRDDYDFVTYGGAVTASKSAFSRRKDKSAFEQIAKKKDPFGFLLANFITNEYSVLNFIFLKEADDNYLRWLTRKESLTYVFTNEIKKLEEPFDYNFILNGTYPPVLKMYQRGEICIETLIILNKLLKLFDHWDNKIQDPYIYPSIKHRCLKYERLLDIDIEKYRKIVLDTFS